MKEVNVIDVKDAEKLCDYDLKLAIVTKYGHVGCCKCNKPTLNLGQTLLAGYDPFMREVYCMWCGIRYYVNVANSRVRLAMDKDMLTMDAIESVLAKAK